MEEIKYGEDMFEIPSGLCDDFSYLLDIISPDTWNNILTDEHREMLMKYLPDFPEDDLNEKTHTLEMFFMNENFYFGSPLQNFFMNLKKGFYNPDITKIRKINRKILHKSYKYRQKKYFHNILEEILVKRKEMLEGVKRRGFDQEQNFLYKQNNSTFPSKKELCLQRARKRYYKEIKSVKSEAGCDSDLSDDDNYSEGIGLCLNKKQRRQLFLLEASFPSNLCPVRSTHTKGSLALDLEANLTSARNPFDSSEEQFRNLLAVHLANHKRRKSFAFDTRGITLKSILERAEMLTKKPLQRPPPLVSSPAIPSRPMLMPGNQVKKSPSKRKPKPPSSPHDMIPIENLKREPSSDSLSSDGETTQDIDVTKDSFCPSPASSTLEDIKSSIRAELTQETHLSFFSLLRDIFCSTTNQRMTKQQLLSSIATWQDSAISPLNEWFCLCDSWVNVLPSAVNFLCGNVSSDYLAPDFVPFIEFKNTLKYFQWIGAGRDSDANLEPLCQYWLSNRDNIGLDWPKDVIFNSDVEDIKPVLINKMAKNWNLKRSIDSADIQENSEYHEQERNRYGQPHRAFTYRMNGYESVIGPVKGVYTQQQSGNTTKARGHLLLVPDRPPYVTILSLVWDAVARLLNSEGTKLDICELLKESQFLVPINTQSLENTLNNVVSGALDRLQNEKDPCVKFDTSRKLWVYLHKSRSEKELEMMHQLKLRSGSNKSKAQPSSRKSGKKKEDASLNQGPPNVSMEQYSPAIKQMDGSEVRIKDEDILKNWVKMASSKSKKKENKISQEQLKQEFNKMKKLNLATLESPVLVCTSESLPEFTTQTIMQSACITDEPKVVVSGEVSPQKICSTIQFSKVSNSLIHTSPSTSTALSSSDVKLQLQLQPQSRKYQSSEKKKSAKQESTFSSTKTTPSTLATTTHTPTKIYHTQPVMTSAVVTQPKGIKLVQYSNPNIQAKGVVGNASLVVDTSSAMSAALVGQKLVVAGNRVLVQGGKVLHNVAAANVAGRTKQVLAGVLPAQHIMTVNNIKKQSSDQHTIEGGRFIQIATVDAPAGYQKQTGYQKLTLVPQFSQATLAPGGQKIQDATTVGTLAKGAITAGELKLKLGSTAFATASGNIISLGGKQILLTTKGTPSNRTAQIHQIVLPASTVGGHQATVVSTSSAGNPVTVTTSGALTHQPRLAIGGQQIVVPASALAGSSLNLKRLQAFQSFKVVPASQLTQQQQPQQRGKPVVAHILAPASTTTTATVVPTTKLTLQVATSSANSLDKSNG